MEKTTKLIVVGGEMEASELVLVLPAIIGRGREAAVVLSHPLVSRRHCEVFEQDGVVRVRDLGSLNGTFVGSEQITESVLRPGDLLTVGTVTFRLAGDGIPEREEADRGNQNDQDSSPAVADTVRAAGSPSDETMRVGAQRPPSEHHDHSTFRDTSPGITDTHE